MIDAVEGILSGLAISPGSEDRPAGYAIAFANGEQLPLDGRLGAGIRIEFAGIVLCRHCGAESGKSFGGGYCYDCFSTLARCLLIRQPIRICATATGFTSFCLLLGDRRSD